MSGDDDKARRDRARELREEIERLKHGAPPPQPKSPRELTEPTRQRRRK